MNYRAANLEEAMGMVRELHAAHPDLWFRGQVRNWPILSSFVRRNAEGRALATTQLDRFYRWLQSVPALRSIATNEDAVLAVAQHYGLATNLLDFSTDPRVAAFFASHEPPDASDDHDVSCIICLRYDELQELCELVRTTRPDMPIPRAIRLDIPELWRLQSQCGLFLEYPFDASFERHFFDFDRIIFPTERDPEALSRLIPERDIYPTQKSDLEMLLDQFFMLERLETGRRSLAASLSNMTRLAIPPPETGIEAGLPIHDSWSAENLTTWHDLEEERWRSRSAMPDCALRYPLAADSPANISNIAEQVRLKLEQDTSLRTGPVNWRISGVEAAPHMMRLLELVWDGLRRWPYSTSDLALSMAMTVEYAILVHQQPAAAKNAKLARRLAEECLGPVVEIEIAIEDRSYTRGFVSPETLTEALRADLFTHWKKEWRSRFSSAVQVIQLASDPRRCFEFDRFQSLFCTQFVPTQVVIRHEGTGKARLFNPARAVRVGLP